MKLARVKGQVVSTIKHDSLHGEKLLLLQPLDENLKEMGAEVVATDVAQAGPGDLVLFEAGREAAMFLSQPRNNISDATVMSIVDSVDLATRSSS